jgi:hypothetical protein
MKPNKQGPHAGCDEAAGIEDFKSKLAQAGLSALELADGGAAGEFSMLIPDRCQPVLFLLVNKRARVSGSTGRYSPGCWLWP